MFFWCALYLGALYTEWSRLKCFIGRWIFSFGVSCIWVPYTQIGVGNNVLLEGGDVLLVCPVSGCLIHREEWVIMSLLVGGDVLLVCPVSGCLIHRVE